MADVSSQQQWDTQSLEKRLEKVMACMEANEKHLTDVKAKNNAIRSENQDLCYHLTGLNNPPLSGVTTPPVMASPPTFFGGLSIRPQSGSRSIPFSSTFSLISRIQPFIPSDGNNEIGQLSDLEQQMTQMIGTRIEYDYMAEGGNRSPFARYILEVEASTKFIPSNLRDYDGSSNPYEYVCHFDKRRDMQIDESKIAKVQSVLVGFSGKQSAAMEKISLPIYVNGVKKIVRFLVTDCSSAYNVILGRPWIHAMQVVPSTFHQVIRFPTLIGVKEIRGDQTSTRDYC
ncbi:hypothetical protein PanWU01x14_293120 [Parasponia andersonii]|uniref:Uncharacterized protein n=1 Tax=Parasponia andersonii TaxID=3476 RepID=A0A2P5AWP3_PARAD|nr:hypothetical protein PanWU01x14_293120 [Parasponia andersonii]